MTLNIGVVTKIMELDVPRLSLITHLVVESPSKDTPGASFVVVKTQSRIAVGERRRSQVCSKNRGIMLDLNCIYHGIRCAVLN